MKKVLITGAAGFVGRHFTKRFLENGDEVTQRSRCVRPGAVSIGFGEASGLILASK